MMLLIMLHPRNVNFIFVWYIPPLVTHLIQFSEGPDRPVGGPTNRPHLDSRWTPSRRSTFSLLSLLFFYLSILTPMSLWYSDTYVYHLYTYISRRLDGLLRLFDLSVISRTFNVKQYYFIFINSFKNKK